MKIFILFFTFSFVLSAGMFLVGCKKEQPQMSELNKDCDCAEEVSADFTISEIAAYNIPNNELITETDTIFAERNVRFSAKTDQAQYTWLIGNETLSSQTVGRYFPSQFSGQDIPVTLIVKKKPNSICFPLDDGIDTLVKWFHVANHNGSLQTMDTTLMEGTYRMKDSNSSDSVDITIDYFYNNSQSTGNGVRIINHHGNQDTIQTDALINNYREFQMRWKLIGYFRYKLNQEAEFIFEDRMVSPNRNYHYKGRKL
ncbi:MAG: hypothetical protein PHQ74_01365 [Crocinitomicaceae bacterium]|nr:hypothetical protein [Crocinitomicaceae bacterium]